MQYNEMEDGMLKIAFDAWEQMAMSEFKRIQEQEDITKVDKESLNSFGWYMANREAIMNELSRRNDKLKFSIEEIFLAVGQKDRSGIFRFYPGSTAYKQYGEQAQGKILYRKSERDALEQLVQIGQLLRSDGIVRLTSHTYNDSIANIEALKIQGFAAKDVMELLNFTFEEVTHSYAEQGTREIPNTINIEVNFNDIDPVIFSLNLTEQIIEMGRPLSRYDLVKYYSYLHIINPASITQDIANNYLIDKSTGEFSDEVNLIILDGKSNRGDLLTDNEKGKFLELRSARFEKRFQLVSKDLSINKKLYVKIYNKNKGLAMGIASVISGFEIETLSAPENDYVIYWDFDRFSHIMFRHYKGIRITESPSFSDPSKQPTSFQYVFQDIRRLIKIIIKNLSSEIDAKLSQGKPFTKTGYYYNGNYYNLRIDPDGRLMQFHPLN